MSLSDLQKSILIGSMLGDGHMSMNGLYPRLKIDRAIKDLDYLKYQYNIFKDYCKSEIVNYSKTDARYDKTHE